MTAQSVITLLILVFVGAFGCTPAMIFSNANETKVVSEAARQAIAVKSSGAPDEPSGSAVLNTNTPSLALSEQPVIHEETLRTPVPKTSIDIATKPAPKAAKSDAVLKKSAPVAGSFAGSASFQEAAGPRADNRLLDLFEKDVDKAVEKAKERHRMEFSGEVSNHPKVRYFINYFSKRTRPYFEKILARSGRYLPMIARVLGEEGLPEELAYLALIESAFLTTSTSSQGAAGLWQFIPSTARLYGLKIDSWVDERRDPEKSTRAAAAYLKDLHNYFGRWYLATAAYNAGPGAIDKAMQRSGAKDFWTLSRKAQLSDETRQFVPKFVAVAIIATNPEKYGFTDIQYESPQEYEEFEIRRSLRLGALAEMAEADVSTIRELNPALVGKTTPQVNDPFLVKLPVGKSIVFAQAYDAISENMAPTAQSITHEVKKGDTLFSIARRYGQEVSALMKLNGLTNARLQIGQKLQILLETLSGRLK